MIESHFSKFSLVFVCSIILLVSSALTAAVAASAASPTNDNQFDYYMFVMRWPGNRCLHKKKACPLPANVNHWTIHGLWPNKNDLRNPAFCEKKKGNEAAIFDPTSPFFTDQKLALVTLWTDYMMPYDGMHFYRHEWQKHGSCSGLQQDTYFKTCLRLRTQLDINARLALHNIIPSSENTYSLQAFKEALVLRKPFVGDQSIFPLFSCVKDKKKRELIDEVIYCVEPHTLQFMTCPDNLRDIHDNRICSFDTKYYYLPVNEPAAADAAVDDGSDAEAAVSIEYQSESTAEMDHAMPKMLMTFLLGTVFSALVLGTVVIAVALVLRRGCKNFYSSHKSAYYVIGNHVDERNQSLFGSA